MIAQGDVFWIEILEAPGSAPARRRLAVVVQADPYNRSQLATVVCVPLTDELLWEEAPGNVLLPARSTGLPKDLVANVSQVTALDRTLLRERAGHLSRQELTLVLAGVRLVLGG